MDDDFISRFFGRRVETSLFPDFNEASELQQMFNQMDDMMKMFNFGSFKMIESDKTKQAFSYYYLIA